MNLLFTDRFNFDYSSNLYLENEINVIRESKIDKKLYIFPNIGPSDSNYVNILKNNGNLRIHPIFAIRYSNAAFEMFENYVGSDLMWITPGLEFEYNKPIIIGFFNFGISKFIGAHQGSNPPEEDIALNAILKSSISLA